MEGATSQVSIQLIPLQEGGSQIGLVDLRIDVPLAMKRSRRRSLSRSKKAVPQARYERKMRPNRSVRCLPGMCLGPIFWYSVFESSEKLVTKISEKPVAVVICGVYPHARLGMTMLTQGGAGRREPRR